MGEKSATTLLAEIEASKQAGLARLLMGLGIRSFSMNAAAIPRVKQVIRSLSTKDCTHFARRVMSLSDPAEIRELILGQNK